MAHPLDGGDWVCLGQTRFFISYCQKMPQMAKISNRDKGKQGLLFESVDSRYGKLAPNFAY